MQRVGLLLMEVMASWEPASVEGSSLSSPLILSGQREPERLSIRPKITQLVSGGTKAVACTSASL